MSITIALMAAITRRSLVAAALAPLGCGRRRGSGFAGYAFVANQEGRSVAAVDLTAFAVARHIALDAAPVDIIAHPKLPAVYVLAPEVGAVFEIDPDRLAIKRRARLGTPAMSMRLAPDGQSLWVLCREPGLLLRLALERLQAESRIPLPALPEHFDLWQGRLAAVSFPHDGAIGLADLEVSAIERLVNAGSDPRLVRFRSDDKQVLVGNGVGRTVTVLDVRTRGTVVQLPLPIEPANFCFKADGGQLFVSGPGMDAVAVIFPYSTEVSETLLAGRAPGAMTAFSSPEHEYLFIANPEPGTITILDIETRRLVAAVAVGQQPSQIVITPDNQYALVLNQKSGDLAVIRIAAIGPRRTTIAPIAPLFTVIPVGSKPVCAAVRAL